MNIAAVTVLFNPLELGINKIMNNINSYLPYVNKLYIIDNSSSSNISLFLDNPKINYLLNANKGGIAGALNLACELAKKENFEWILTMDQDSSFDDGVFLNYLRSVEIFLINNKNAVSFSPLIKNNNIKSKNFSLKAIIKKNILKKNSIQNTPKIIFPSRVITSGNILNIPAWEKVNKFDELLFIDQVDFDICHKFLRCNYKIICFTDIVLNHFLGVKSYKTLFKRKTPLESDFRLYYIIRNILIEKKRFPEFNKYYKKNLNEYLFDNLINTFPPFCKIKIILKAYNDYKKLYKEGKI